MNINTVNYNELNKLLEEVKDIINKGKIKLIKINGCKLICYENGTIYRLTKTGKYKLVENTDNMKGYNKLNCNGKMYRRHRIVSYAFLKLNIDDVKAIVDHKDSNKLNNSVNNLRIVTQQQNTFNTNAKGYFFDTSKNKYRAQIRLNKKIHLGYFTTKEEARNAYLNAKLVYHKI